MIKLDKKINYLFYLNTNEYNRAERKIRKVLVEVYEQDKKEGRKEQLRSIKKMLSI